MEPYSKGKNRPCLVKLTPIPSIDCYQLATLYHLPPL